MRKLIIIAILCAELVGCNNQPAEKPPEIPKELTPIPDTTYEIRHIEGHKIVVFNHRNGRGGQFFALDLGKIEEQKP